MGAGELNFSESFVGLLANVVWSSFAGLFADARVHDAGGFAGNIEGPTLGSPTCTRTPMSASDGPSTFPAARVLGCRCRLVMGLEMGAR